MADALQTARDAVTAARARGDAAGTAEALVALANVLLRQSAWHDALTAVDEAAALNRSLQQPQREAQCLRMAAALCRFAGQPVDARIRARQALALVEPDDPLAVAAWTEIAEAAMQQSLADEADAAWSEALSASVRSRAAGPARAALLQRRAVVRAHAKRVDDANADLQAAQALWLQAGDATAARRVQTERATLLQGAGRAAECDALLPTLFAEARKAGDAQMLADLWLLRATQALERRDAAAARDAGLQAREAALQASAPISYFAAARAIATASSALGDRVQAYRALATAWATLSDLLGGDTARAWVAPALEALKREWGDDAFAAARTAHDQQRRAELGAR